MTQTMEQIVSQAVAPFGMTASTVTNLVVVRDRKGRVCGNVNTDGVIDRKYDGKQALMGAIVRDAIAGAIKTAKADHAR